jgi:Na+-transporting NADH:ubiquinone oxidoreductase subunit NqrF
VRIVSGDLDSSKSFYINDIDYEDGWRLACTSRVKEDVVVFVKEF